MSDHTWAGVSASLFEKDVQKIADRLRYLADEVEQAGRATRNPTRTEDPNPDYLRAAERAVHAVVWGVANLSLDGLIASAAEATRAASEVSVPTA
jgi:hypothetical protein